MPRHTLVQISYVALLALQLAHVSLSYLVPVLDHSKYMLLHAIAY